MRKLMVAAMAAILTASLFAVEPPANDSMNDAEAISGESGSVEGTVAGATQDGDKDPIYVAFDIANSVWYRWKAPSAGYFRFDTVGSDADTVMCIYDGKSEKTIKSDDDGAELEWELASKILLQAKAGTEYLIGIGTYSYWTCEWSPEDEDTGEMPEYCYEDEGSPKSFVLNWRKLDAKVKVVLAVTTAPLNDESAGGKATGGGTYAIGKKVALKATPDKGCVFAGWYFPFYGGSVCDPDDPGELRYAALDGDTDWRNPSFPYVVDDDTDVDIVARFAKAEEDYLEIRIGAYYEQWVCADDECEDGYYDWEFFDLRCIYVSEWTDWVTGRFAMDLASMVNSVSLPKITVKGLPAGLKYDSKTGLISGTATKPGVYNVTISATNATIKKPVVKEIEFIVPNLSCEAMSGLESAAEAYGTIYAGVAFDPGLVDCTAEDGWAVKASGLPAGLSFKDGEITGVPTKAGTYTVTFTATKGKEKQTATITLRVEALPDWATGTFTGCVWPLTWEDPSTVSEDDVGFATITVGANGKTSGKVSFGGTNWTFSASGYSSVDAESDWIWDDETETEEYLSWVERCRISGELKSGKTTIPVAIEIEQFDEGEGGPSGLVNSFAREYDEVDHVEGDRTFEFWMVRNMWKDKATADAAKEELAKWKGVYTLTMYSAGYLSITVGKDGTVKASGKLGDGTSVSATSPLMYDPWNAEGYFAMFYTAPSAYNGGCFWLPVGFGAERGTLVNFWGGRWKNLNPQATGDYGEIRDEDLEFEGAYYDSAQKLSDYYETLRFSAEAPALYYTFKETYVDEERGKKVVFPYIDYAEAAETLGQEGCTVGVGEKGFTVAKATKPVQDRITKEWSYNGTNDGALTLSFAQATGIFKGSYTFWYDYTSAYDATKPEGREETVSHTSKKASFEGVWVQGIPLHGFFAWEQPATYVDPKTQKEKTYKYKSNCGISLDAE